MGSMKVATALDINSKTASRNGKYSLHRDEWPEDLFVVVDSSARRAFDFIESKWPDSSKSDNYLIFYASSPGEALILLRNLNVLLSVENNSKCHLRGLYICGGDVFVDGKHAEDLIAAVLNEFPSLVTEEIALFEPSDNNGSNGGFCLSERRVKKPEILQGDERVNSPTRKLNRQLAILKQLSLLREISPPISLPNIALPFASLASPEFQD